MSKIGDLTIYCRDANSTQVNAGTISVNEGNGTLTLTCGGTTSECLTTESSCTAVPGFDPTQIEKTVIYRGTNGTKLFATRDEMLKFITNTERRAEKSAYSTKTVQDTPALIGDLLTASFGPAVLLENTETSPIAPSVLGTSYTHESNPYDGAGVRITLGVGPFNLHPLFDKEATDDTKTLSWTSAGLSFVNLGLSYMHLQGTGNSHISSDSDTESHFRLDTVGLDLNFGLYLSTIRQFMNKDPQSWDLYLTASANLLHYTNYAFDAQAAASSSKKLDGNFNGASSFSIWTLCGGGNYRTSVGSIGLALCGMPQFTIENGENFSTDISALSIELKFGFPPVLEPRTKSETTFDGRVTIDVAQNPTIIPAPAPAEAPVQLKKINLKDFVGFEIPVTVHLATSKIDLTAEDKAAVTKALQDAVKRYLKLPGTGWQLVIESRAHADSRGSTVRNDSLSMGRAQSVNTIILGLATENDIPLTGGAVRAIGRGEHEVLDQSGKVIPNADTCKEGRTDKKADTRIRKCSGTEVIENMKASRRVETIIRAIPPGAPNLKAAEGVEATQLAVDNNVGPTIAKALVGRNKFTEATYEPESNTIFVKVDSLEPKKLAAWKRAIEATKRNAGKVSFGLTAIVQIANKPADWQTIVQNGLYNFRTFPFAGGLSISEAGTTSMLDALVKKAKESAKAAKTISSEMQRDAKEINGATVYRRAWNANELPEANIRAFYSLGKTLKKLVGGQTIAMIVNRAEPKSGFDTLVKTAGYGLQSGLGDTFDVQTYSTADKRLANEIMIVTIPQDSAIDLTQPNKAETKAFLEGLKTAQ